MLPPPNRRRAIAASMAIATYVAAKDDDGKGLQELNETMTDLLTDLRHLSAWLGVDFEKAVMRSHLHYEDESS
jgi:hypothetical protein